MSNKLKLLLIYTIVPIFILWLIGLFLFVSLIPKNDNSYKTNDIKNIIALTGGSKRISTAIDIFLESKDSELLISGVGKNIDLNKIANKYGYDKLDSNRITLGHIATNTELNAMEVSAWMNLNNIDEAILVTSNYHFPRALYEIKSIAKDKKITAYPVFPESIDKNKWWYDYQTAKFFISEYNKYIVSHIRVYLLYNSSK